MGRLGTILNFAALFVVALGLVGLHQLYQPSSSAEIIDTLLEHSIHAVNPLTLAAALVAIATSLAAWSLDRPTTSTVAAPRIHQLQMVDPTAPRPAGLAANAEHERDLLRVRLGALLRDDGGAPAVIDELIATGLNRGASDIHIQPLEGSSRISMRVQGELEEVASVNDAFHNPLVRRLKVLARLITYKSNEPQDGQFTVESVFGSAEVRVSLLPTRYGEKAVLRIARSAGEMRRIRDLGMTDVQRDAFEALLNEPQGLILLTGPTGSGKTTTIYTALSHINEHRGRTINIATIEDPIEVGLPFASQTQVDRGRGLGFAEGLRAVLRQDPNVLAIGEIRDPETAEIAVQAGLTGHLILTTVHAESTVGVFARLIDTGTEPFLVASSTLACVSQRLVRTLCPHCRRPEEVDRRTRAELVRRGLIGHVSADETHVERPREPGTFWNARGCKSCDLTGLSGRTAIYELLRLTPELRQLITTKVPTSEIMAAARNSGLRTLADSARDLLQDGQISAEEALRVVA